MTKWFPDAVIKRLDVLNDEMQAIAADDNLTAAQERRWHELYGEFQRLMFEHGESDKTSRTRDLLNAKHSESGVSYSESVGIRDHAHRVVDSLSRSGVLADRPAETVTGLLERGHPGARRAAGAYVRAVGDPNYLSAFRKLFAGPAGHMTWTGPEREAFAAVEEYRAMSLTDSAGGYMVPLSLDPAVILSNSGVASVLRQTAKVVTITTDVWNGVTSAGVTAEFQAESAEVNDNSPTLAQPTVPVHRLNAFVPYSLEVGQDAVGFVEEMTRLLMDAATVRETQAFVTGTGSGEPTGIVTALAGGSSIVTGSGEAFTAANVFAVQAALGPRFQQNAVWMGNVATLNAISQFETANGARHFPEVNAAPSTLLRKALFELSPMDGVINASATEANHILLYGDLAQGYVIADRLGAVVEGVPHLFGANQRPTGQRGLVLWQRVGGNVVNAAALRLLNVPTTA